MAFGSAARIKPDAFRVSRAKLVLPYTTGNGIHSNYKKWGIDGIVQ